jgi:hypothetical protein
MNPFELRYQMLNTAREMLEQEYHAKKANGETAVWPTLDQVLERANALNKFVSDK